MKKAEKIEMCTLARCAINDAWSVIDLVPEWITKLTKEPDPGPAVFERLERDGFIVWTGDQYRLTGVGWARLNTARPHVVPLPEPSARRLS